MFVFKKKSTEQTDRQAVLKKNIEERRRKQKDWTHEDITGYSVARKKYDKDLFGKEEFLDYIMNEFNICRDEAELIAAEFEAAGCDFEKTTALMA